MKTFSLTKDSFCVIGKEGSSREGKGFVQRLWQETNTHFEQISPLAKRDEQGELLGFWGAMSDFSRCFHPWEQDFSQGLYLAGVECIEDALPPEGWQKWTIPGYEYLCTPMETDSSFSDTLAHLQKEHIALVGAVHEFTCPKTGRCYLCFPIRKL